jgi:hypothetical protein
VYFPDSDWTCWLYSFYIDPCEAFVQEEGTIYWLALQAHIYEPDPMWEWRFGWKNSSEQWNDDAVCSVGRLPDNLGGWNELRHPVTSDSVDLAFKITTEPECYLWEGQTQAEYDYWVESGKPECWCYPRQCHGDADGKKQGSFTPGYWYVGSDDLDIMSLGWLVRDPPKGPGILGLELNGVPVACADFKRDKVGSPFPGYWRIGATDLDEMSLNWLIKEPPKGPGTPPDCQPGNRTP